MALTLIEAMLELSKLTGIAYTGTSTGGSTTTLEDSQNEFETDKFTGGTLWITSGTNIGKCKTIIKSSGGLFTWDTALANTVAAGVSYVVAMNKFPREQLKQSINFTLGRLDIIKADDTLLVENSDEYDLPEGVKNVKRVYVSTESANPYGFIENFSWKEYAGKIVFQPGKQPVNTGKIIRLVYLGKHGELGEDDTLDESVNEDYVLWASAKQLWRSRIVVMGKDDPQAYDFYNEAVQETINEAAKGKSIKVHKAVTHSGF